MKLFTTSLIILAIAVFVSVYEAPEPPKELPYTATIQCPFGGSYSFARGDETIRVTCNI